MKALDEIYQNKISLQLSDLKNSAVFRHEFQLFFNLLKFFHNFQEQNNFQNVPIFLTACAET